MKALIGTPLGSSHAASNEGHCEVAQVKRELGCAARRPDSGVQSFPCQSMRCLGTGPSLPYHHTSPSSVSATLVKIVSHSIIFMALGFVLLDVPGTTPK